ncbi:hypothetical protein MM2B0307_2497 [Mycobacteroides abscessus subsp. bolletii 2B-0307]|nr:hypothetical protein MM2B0307_2497 [Mycobacteroides abscessus subsp. bolletii 2B-0307]
MAYEHRLGLSGRRCERHPLIDLVCLLREGLYVVDGRV